MGLLDRKHISSIHAKLSEMWVYRGRERLII